MTNSILQSGENVWIEAVEYRPDRIDAHQLDSLPLGTVVKFWSKTDPDGIPIARAYGTLGVKAGKAVVL
jgi:hypothetical protein